MLNPSSHTPLPEGEGDRTITSVDSAAERWRTALTNQTGQSMDQFLPDRGTPRRTETLRALIAIALEVRIGRNELCRLEMFQPYLAELPAEEMLNLILVELGARQKRGEVVKRREFAERFPEHYDALKERTSGTGSTVSRQLPRRPQALGAGQSLGDYEIITRLGAGSYADVYLARQKSLGRNVALKVSLGKRSEAQTLAKLDHPNIVQVYSEHSVASHQLLVMRYVPGRTLDGWMEHRQQAGGRVWQGQHLLDWLRAEGEPSDRARDAREREIRDKRLTDIAAYLFLDLARALAHAHQRGVLHLDIKPSNILLDMDGRALLMDFNVSALPGASGIHGAKPSGGTLAYMPPEQLDHFIKDLKQTSQIDTRTDLFSLGVVMYELIAGVSPWPVPDDRAATSSIRQLLAQRLTRPVPLAKAQGAVSPGLAAIVDQLISPAPQDRYPTAQALLEDLQNWFDHRPLAVAQAGILERSRNWVIRNSTALSCGGAILLGAALFALGKWSGPASPTSKAPPPHAVATTAPSSGPPAQEDTIKGPAPKAVKTEDVDTPPALQGDGRDKPTQPLESMAEALRPRKRSPLRVHLQKARRQSRDQWELAINPLTLHGVDLEDDWETRYTMLARLNPRQQEVVYAAVTEVLLVQLAVHGESHPELKTRFLVRLPKQHRSLALVRYLSHQLKIHNMSEIATSSLVAIAETEFERYLMAIVAAIRNEHETALTLFRRSLRENPDRHTTSYYLGLCAERAGRTTEAIRAYKRCQQEQPQFVPAYLGLGSLYLGQGDTAGALAQFRSAMDVAQSPDVALRVANAFLQSDRPALALGALNYLIDEKERRSAASLTKRANVKLRLGNRAGARADLHEALRLQPGFVEAQQRLRQLGDKRN